MMGLTRQNRASRINNNKVKCSLGREANDASTVVPGTLPIPYLVAFMLFD